MEERSEFQNLEQLLTRAGKSISYPATPALAARARLELESQSRQGRAWVQRRAFGLAFAIILAIGLLLALPETREALAQLLGLRTIRIIPVTPTPTWRSQSPAPLLSGEAGATPTPMPGAQCCETTLAEAQAKSRFKISLPPSQTPSRVYLQMIPDFGIGAQQVILVFADPSAPQFSLYQATNFLYGKIVSGGTTISETRVKGQRALWLTGAPHLLVYLDSDNRIRLESERVVNLNTLAWESGGVTYRLETTMGKEDANRIAESLQ
jgi:hypothetical protein